MSALNKRTLGLGIVSLVLATLLCVLSLGPVVALLTRPNRTLQWPERVLVHRLYRPVFRLRDRSPTFDDFMYWYIDLCGGIWSSHPATARTVLS